MKVYVVTHGDYSDYHICAIFSTEKKAQEYADSFVDKEGNASYNQASIQKWEVDEDCAVPVGMRIFRIKLDVFTGDVCDSELIYPDDSEELDYPDKVVSDWCGSEYTITVLARDRDHAIKIANEKLAQYKADYPLALATIEKEIKTEMDIRIGNVFGYMKEGSYQEAQIKATYEKIIELSSHIDTSEMFTEFYRLFPYYQNTAGE
jgi:hypothetical protein